MLNFTLKGLLSRDELQREKTKDYRNVVIIQIAIVVIGLTLSEPILRDSQSNVSKAIISLFSFFGAAYILLLWDLLRNFTTSRVLLLTLLGILAAVIITGILVEFPYYQVIEVADRRTYLLVVHCALFPVEVTVISFAAFRSEACMISFRRRYPKVSVFRSNPGFPQRNTQYPITNIQYPTQNFRLQTPNYYE